MSKNLISFVVLAGLAGTAHAHDGRRFDIQIWEGQLVAQGYLSGSNPVDDGGGVVRPYVNAIHAHWTNHPSDLTETASATLPGFDILDTAGLAGHGVSVELLGGQKWVAPPMMPPAGTVPTFGALSAQERIFVGFDGAFVDTTNPGTHELSSSVPGGSLADLDLSFFIDIEPENTLFVLEFRLSTDAPGIAASDSIFMILSPDGDSPMTRLHHASLFTEAYLGTVIPAPAGMTLLVGAGLLASRRRR